MRPSPALPLKQAPNGLPQPGQHAESRGALPFTKECLLFATADWDTPCWTNKQHTAHHLALQGFRVLYIESPGLRPPGANSKDLGRLWRRLRRGLRPPREVEPGVWLLSPIALPIKHHWKAVRTFNQGWLRLRIKGFMSRQGFTRPLVWSYHPFMLSVLQKIQHGPLVYHCVDDLAAIPGVDAERFRHEEQRLLQRCSAVFVTSVPLHQKCLPYNSETHLLPNVVDSDHFGMARRAGPLPEDLAQIPRPRIVYIGTLSDFKLDFALIHRVAAARPEWHWVLIGEEREGQRSTLLARLATLDNVHLLGHKPYRQLPDYLRGADVGTLPSLLNDYTRSMFPMKYFEYLAAGVPIVSTPLEFTQQFRGGLEAASDADGFIAAIERQLSRGKLNDAEVMACVGDNNWSARLQKMLAIVESCR